MEITNSVFFMTLGGKWKALFLFWRRNCHGSTIRSRFLGCLNFLPLGKKTKVCLFTENSSVFQLSCLLSDKRTKARIQFLCVNFTCFTNNLIVVLPALLVICLPNFRESEAGILQT